VRRTNLLARVASVNDRWPFPDGIVDEACGAATGEFNQIRPHGAEHHRASSASSRFSVPCYLLAAVLIRLRHDQRHEISSSTFTYKLRVRAVLPGNITTPDRMQRSDLDDRPTTTNALVDVADRSVPRYPMRPLLFLCR
jgi:hypothetical protein